MMIDKRPALLLKHLLKVKNTTMNQVMDQHSINQAANFL